MPRQIRALVFDEDEMTRSLFRRFFEKHGYEVFSFAKPFWCLECDVPADEICADIILADVFMSDISGFEFADKLRTVGCKIQKIALVSGSWDNENQVRARDLDCQIFSKPLEYPVLAGWLKLVEKDLDLSKSLACRFSD